MQFLVLLTQNLFQKFELHREELRRDQRRWLVKTSQVLKPFRQHRLQMAEKYSGIKQPLMIDEKKWFKRHPDPPVHRKKWLPIPQRYNNLTWLLHYMVPDLKNRSVYLNASMPKRVEFNRLPKPFFSSSLRARASTISRLIR